MPGERHRKYSLALIRTFNSTVFKRSPSRAEMVSFCSRQQVLFQFTPHNYDEMDGRLFEVSSGDSVSIQQLIRVLVAQLYL